jgi:3D (Asp-Asp-Asp) domain-containing protein
MTSIFSTALTGLLLLSSASTTATNAQPWTKTAPIEPTYVTHTVSMTGYNAVAGQTDDTPFVTSIGLRVNPEIGAAASRDLIKTDLPYGTVIELVPNSAEAATGGCELPAVVDFIQYRVITDTMHPRRTNHVDVLFDASDKVTIGRNTLSAARAIGWCNNVQIRVVGKIDLKEVPETQKELRAIVTEQLENAVNQDIALAK